MKKCLIIYNPVSGKGINSKILDEYYKMLLENDYKADFIKTEYSSHASEIVKNSENYDIVFSIGGDGTLNEVIKGNYERKNKLTICPLPSGTCNDVATMFGYSKNPINNLKMAINGDINNIDIGTINNRPFVYVVGMGKFMNIPYETSSVEKRKNGYIAYIKEATNEIFNLVKEYKAEINVDGLKLDGNYSLIMVSNSNHIAGINNFYKDIFLNDGKMELLLCKASNQQDFISNFLKFFSGYKAEQIIYLKAKEISIKLLEKPLKEWCIDGEKYNYNGNQYNIKIEDKMKFLIPKTKVRKLLKNCNK